MGLAWQQGPSAPGAIGRFLEGPAHDLVRDRLTMLASRHGWPSRIRDARIDPGHIAAPVEAGQIANH